jgi:sugar lactone lactonase YvrE
MFSDGQLYISSRHDGTVLRYTDYEHLDVVVEDLSSVRTVCRKPAVWETVREIYRVDTSSGNREEFAHLEPSIAAYHLAVDSEDRLYVTAPTFSMRDRLNRFSSNGKSESLVNGLARPQGMAFLPDGDLLLCTGYEGKKGVFRYAPKNGSFSHYISAPIPIGLAIAGQDIFLATRDSLYWTSLPGNTALN